MTRAGLPVCLTLLAGLAVAQTPPALEQARAASTERGDPERAREAFVAYMEAVRSGEQPYEAGWEAARSAWFYGTITLEQAPESERLDIYQQGIDAAKKAIEARPKGAEAHFWLGVLYGVYGETKGVLKSLSLVDDIQEQMGIAQEIDPSVEDWGPDRVIGRMYFKLPWFKGGSTKKSIEHLERSLAGAPDVVITRLYLAESYLDAGERAKAREQLETILAGNRSPAHQPEYDWVRPQAEAMLRKVR